jgi:hypothetical protein
MKKVAICTLLLILSFTSFCQDTQPSTPLTREDYLKKSKTQKVLGFVFLGAGAITLISVSGGNTDLGTAGVLIVAGGLATLTSIPLFIASGKNKRKAKDASLSFKFEKIQTIQPAGISFHASPVISLKINL